MIAKNTFAVMMPLAVIAALTSRDEFWVNAALGIFWPLTVLGILGGFLAFNPGEEGEKLRSLLRDRPVWRVWYGRVIDLPLAVVLAGYEHWALFSVFVFQVVVFWAAEQRASEPQPNEGQNDD